MPRTEAFTSSRLSSGFGVSKASDPIAGTCSVLQHVWWARRLSCSARGGSKFDSHFNVLDSFFLENFSIERNTDFADFPGLGIAADFVRLEFVVFVDVLPGLGELNVGQLLLGGYGDVCRQLGHR